MGRVLFITGTDTGVGKTVLTGLLLARALEKGLKVRALKPVCTGDRADGELLFQLQSGKLPLNQINPLFFATPVTPLLASRLEGTQLTMSHLMALVLAHESDSDLLLVEGAGGLLSPLGENFSLADLAEALSPEVIIAAHNKLGVLNHTLLTVEVLKKRQGIHPRIALMEHGGPPDPSQNYNLQLLQELLPRTTIELIPPLNKVDAEEIRKTAEALRPKLDRLLQKEA
jgi:dethiobiotin synthetase